jgi:hypothetical protein
LTSAVLGDKKSLLYRDFKNVLPIIRTVLLINWLRRARIELEFQVASQRKLWSILGCLLQPGLLLDQPLKSMRINSFQLIKFCDTWPDPAAETKSIGLQVDSQLSWFLHANLTTLS